MTAPTDPPENAAEPIPAGLVEVGMYPTAAAAFEHGLVVLAAGRPYWIISSGPQCRLCVEAADAEDVQWQLACFERESVGWPPPPPPLGEPRRFRIIGPLLWALLVLGVYWGEGSHPGWIARGDLDSRAVFDRGQWWRAATALFLHADAGHVVSNGLTGIFVFSAVVSTFGRLRGWLLLAAAAVAGNLGSAALHYPGPYRSIGASTAVFAAVGLLAGRAAAIILRTAGPSRWRAMFTPVAAGVAVLGLYGAGGVNIDVTAHLSGFVCGLALGLAASLARRQEP